MYERGVVREFAEACHCEVSRLLLQFTRARISEHYAHNLSAKASKIELVTTNLKKTYGACCSFII